MSERPEALLVVLTKWRHCGVGAYYRNRKWEAEEFEKVQGCVPLGWSGSGSVIRDQSDHGRSNEPMNPCPEWIHWFIWSTMIRVIRDHWSWSWSWSSQRNAHWPLVSWFGWRQTNLDGAISVDLHDIGDLWWPRTPSNFQRWPNDPVVCTALKIYNHILWRLQKNQLRKYLLSG